MRFFGQIQARRVLFYSLRGWVRPRRSKVYDSKCCSFDIKKKLCQFLNGLKLIGFQILISPLEEKVIEQKDCELEHGHAWNILCQYFYLCKSQFQIFNFTPKRGGPKYN